MGAGVGLSDDVIWLTSSFGGISVGAEAGYLIGSLGVFHEMNDTVCSILGAPDMCSMVVHEHLACVALLYDQNMGVLVFELIYIVLTRDLWDNYRTSLIEYVAHYVSSLAGE